MGGRSLQNHKKAEGVKCVEKHGIFLFGILVGIVISTITIASQSILKPQTTVLEPTYKWKCTKPYIYQGNYWITCEKLVCMKIDDKDFCKSLGDKLKLELVR